MYMSRIRGPYVRFCERDEAVTPHPTRCACSTVAQTLKTQKTGVVNLTNLLVKYAKKLYLVAWCTVGNFRN